MIISAGYNIAGPEVEAALLSHKQVLECAVIGTPDDNRGAIVQAHIVLTEDSTESNELKIELQDYVKAKIAPFKYPRSIIFKNSLPKTQTGKIQRFLLRNQQNMEIKNVS
jgi:2-aminobenzoate-CoA ligase